MLFSQACGAVGNLSLNDDNAVLLASLGVCETLTAVLARPSVAAAPCVAMWALFAIGNLAYDDNNRATFGSIGAVEQTMKTMQMHSTHAGVAEW